jgi:glycosyl transferase family WbsX
MTPAPFPNPCQVAAYYFPNWHPSPRNNDYYGLGENEWKIVQAARPRFAGHQQPKVPAWGYEDEALPENMAKKIDAAADHGVDAFIFDWYWYDNGAMLHEALENAFLQAPNRDRLKFGIMWANHDPVTRATFEAAVDNCLAAYFKQPNYWNVDGKPYFSIYEFHTLIKGLGGLGETRAALDYLRECASAAGLPGVHLNAVEWGLQQLPPEYADDRNAFLAYMGVDSVTSYVWIHNPVIPDFPTNAYPVVAERVADFWDAFTGEFGVPYHPNVTMGWDSWPRVPASQPFAAGAYPAFPLLTENTPAAFRDALEAARYFVESHPASQGIITINAWNEWTEGSYLEPDTTHGMAYLEAIRDVFTPLPATNEASSNQAGGQ